MRDDLFRQYVEGARDCDAALLDNAVAKGLHRAKCNAFDYKKLFNLAVACVVTAALCFAVKAEPIRAMASGFMQDSAPMTESGSEALHGYVRSVIDTIMNYMGGI